MTAHQFLIDFLTDPHYAPMYMKVIRYGIEVVFALWMLGFFSRSKV